MKLSEAILLSIGVVKEDRTTYFESSIEGPRGCAIGTALYSIGYHNWINNYIETVERVWPWTRNGIADEISARHVCGESRESLAAWIASVEPKEDELVEQLKEASTLVQVS